MEKFKLLKDDSKEYEGETVYRIKALKDVIGLNGNIIVNAGDLGGYISEEVDIDDNDSSWVYGNSIVCGSCYICGNSSIIDSTWYNKLKRNERTNRMESSIIKDSIIFDDVDLSDCTIINCTIRGYASICEINIKDVSKIIDVEDIEPDVIQLHNNKYDLLLYFSKDDNGKLQCCFEFLGGSPNPVLKNKFKELIDKYNSCDWIEQSVIISDIDDLLDEYTDIAELINEMKNDNQ